MSDKKDDDRNHKINLVKITLITLTGPRKLITEVLSQFTFVLLSIKKAESFPRRGAK